jgi:tetratricopeptide (TPR) repeat protein
MRGTTTALLVALVALTACAGQVEAQVGDSQPVSIGAGSRPSTDERGGLAAAEAKAAANPQDLQSQLDLGAAYYNADSLRLAADAFRRALAIDAASVPALVNLGVVLNDLGLAPEAVGYLEQAVALKPDDVAARTNLAMAHYTSGDIETAVRLLVQVIERDPGNQLAHFQLGAAFADAQLFEEALSEWRAVIAADPETAAGKQALQNIQRVEAIFAAERVRQQQDAIRSSR